MATHIPQPPSPRGRQRSSGRRPGSKWSLTSALYATNTCVHLQVDNPQCRERLREGLCGVCRQWVHWGSTQTYPLPQSNQVTTATCELENLCWIYCGKMRCILIAALAVITCVLSGLGLWYHWSTAVTFLPKVVFVSPFEHHSNLLPWREIGAEASGTTTLISSLIPHSVVTA